MELSAGGVEGALLIFGGAVADRAAFTVENRKHDLIHRPFFQPRGVVEVADQLAAKQPQVVAMLTQGFAR